jgi:hypothetical protein
MAGFATGKYSKAISDRSGMEFPYDEMVTEWNGSLVHISEFEPKHPQIRRKKVTADRIALQNSRTQDFTFNSGGARFTTINLTLPGMFAFSSDGMQPDDGSAQNRKRQAITNVGQVTVEIS